MSHRVPIPARLPALLLLLGSLVLSAAWLRPAAAAGHLEVVTGPGRAWANGHARTDLIVRVRDGAGAPAAGRVITLRAERADGVRVEPAGGQAATDARGEATFRVRSTRAGPVTLTAADLTDATLTTAVAVEFVQRRVVVLIQGLNTNLSQANEQTTFSATRERLQARGFTILNYSYRGGVVDAASGAWSPNAYGCGDTAQSLRDRSLPLVKALLLDVARENPNTRFVVIGHSQGGLIALRTLEIAFEQPDLALDAVITLDGALGGAPSEHTAMVAGLTCWGPPASDELVELWRTASDPERLGTTAYNNQALVAFARERGIAVWTVGNGSDCVWNPRRCGVLLGNSSSTQVVQGAELYFPRLGEPCTDRSCLTVSHDRVLEHPAVLDLIERVAGSPTVP